MAFKNLNNTAAIPDNPEALFLDFRNRRVKGLIAHQADVLRAYIDKAKDLPDVAFQLPTGSGKTLVGLLLGEWRRRTFGERVVYLCPTKQLVNQVVEQARKDYGMKVTGFVGSQRDYSQKSKTEYLSGDTIGVTTYSGLFNTNPFFSDPNIIILDDAHSAENYIASQWSVRIERSNDDHSILFKKIVQLLKPRLASTDYQKLTGNEQSLWDKTWVEKIPTSHVYPLVPELVQIIDAEVENTNLRFPWSLIRNNLAACQLYLGSSEILIRPLIPPSDKHLPFSGATQRVYMSATLGEGGDLERLTGRKNIFRLPVPGNWEKQGIGRKFFLFPETSLPTDEAEDLVFEMMKKSGRSLVITPDEQNARRYRQLVADKLAFPTFGASEIEQSKDSFISEAQAVAVVANRYDGIDFPNDECRFLVIDNIARATNLQEKFFVTRMGSAVLLNDRIVTRLQQAFGRCTRATTDYASIVISGGDLFSYLLKPDKRELFHPELQAELKFGIEQSKDSTPAAFLENLQFFLSQGDEWEEAEKNIVSLRVASIQKKSPALTELQGIVKHEIEYQYSMWNEDYAGALEYARKVLTGLTNADLRGYRAFWLYLAGGAAWLAHEVSKIDGMEGVAQTYFQQSASALAGGCMVSRLGRVKQVKTATAAGGVGSNWETMILIEQLEINLANQGMIHDHSYDRYEKSILDNIMENDAKKFERGQVLLGGLLGFKSGNEETNGAPDPWWMVNEGLCFVFEDHSDAQETSSLSVKKARQAATHPNWVKEKLSLDDDAQIISVLVTPVKKADTDALLHLGNVCLWDLIEFRDWAQNALKTVRQLRLTFTDIGNLDWRDKAVEKYDAENLSPKNLSAKLLAQPAREILTEPKD